MTKRTGPPPTPTNLRLLKGNPGKRAINKNEPQGNADAVKMPSGLTARGKKVWRKVAPMLQSAGLLTDLDVLALKGLCDAYADYEDYREQVAQSSPIIKAPSGYPVQNPLISIERKAWEKFMRLMAEFGMTPAARSRIQVEQPDDEGDELDALIRARRGK